MKGPTSRPYRDFGVWLKSRRLARRWTQEELARRLGYDVSYIRKIEWGERRASDALRTRLALVLGVPVSSLPASVGAGTPGRLPEPPAPLIGRAEELVDVAHLFDEGTRLVTIVGPPGIGKTSVALALASRYDGLLPGGARYVPLAGVEAAGGVLLAIAEALGIPAPAGDELGRLVDGLRAQEILLVLDDFEHVVKAAPLVGELLAKVPKLRILATSRQALELRLETQFALPPLAVPVRTDEPVDRLADVASVALFVARARKVNREFRLDAGNARAVADVCARLQGIPLAIELAAATARLLTPPALLAQLGNGLDLPVHGPLDAPAHHRTLRAAIGWSFDLLRPEEKALMSRLAVFVDGCTLEAANAVCQLDEGALDPSAGLLALVAKSLVEPVADGDVGVRFTTLEAVRGFALECLAVSGEVGTARRRHAAWFLGLAETNEVRLKGPDQVEALAVLEVEHANLRAAIQWSLEHDPAVAVRLCAALWRFWRVRGHLVEGRQWLDAALGHVGPDEGQRAHILIASGVLARTHGAYGRALEYLEHGAALSRSAGDRGRLGLALANMAFIAEERGQHGPAQDLYGESRRLFTALGEPRGVAHAVNGLGTVSMGRGELEAAGVLLEEALSIFREIGDIWSTAMVLRNLGRTAQEQGRIQVATSLYQKGMALYRTLGDERGVANILINLGTLIYASGDGEDCAGMFEEALLTYARLGERRGVADCLWALAISREGAEPKGSAVLLGAADALRRSIGASLPPNHVASQDLVVEGLRARLSEGALDAAWQEGRMLGIDEVVAVALGQQP